MKSVRLLLVFLLSYLVHFSVEAQTTYYYDGSGSLSSTSNWGTNTNGSGSNPGNFSSNNQIFEIRNTTAVTLSGNWTVSGTGSKVVLGNASVTAITLTHSGGDFNGTLDINAASSGSNTYLGQTTNANTPTLGTLNSGSTVRYDRNGTQTVQAVTYGNLYISNAGGTKTAGGTVTVNGTLTIDASCTFNMSTNLLSGNPTSTSGTGTLQTQNTANPAIPSGESWTFTVEYNGAAQTMEAGTYANLTCSGSGDKTGEAITVNGILTINAGRILNMGTNALSGNPTSTSGTGTLQTQNTSNPAIPNGETWAFTVEYNGGAQTVEAGTYSTALTISGSGDKTGEAITVNGVLTINAGRILDMGTNALSGNPTSTSGTGTLQTQNTSNPAIPTGETWTFTVEYNGGTQTVEAGTYSAALTISGSGDKTGEAITVNGVLTINAGRILNMGTNELSGNPTSTSGTGTLRTQNLGTPVPAGETWTFAIEYNSASAQNISSGNYTDLNGTGGNRVLPNGLTVAVSGTYTPGSGTYTVTGNTFDFNGNTQNIPAATFNNLTISGAGDKTATGTITVNAILTINAGRILNMGTNLLSGNPTSTSGTGTLQTQNTSNPAIPTGETWAFTVEYNGGAQTVEAGTYSTALTVSGSGDKTSDAITVNGILTINSGRILNMGTNALSGNPTSTSGTGTLQTQNTGNPAIPSGETWAFTVEYNGGAQTVEAGTYSTALTISGSGDKTGEAITVNGALTINSGRILSMGTNLLSGNPTSTSGTGTLQTQNTANPAIPTGETWTFTVEYNGIAQTVEAGTYANLTCSGTGDKTGEAITVNGILTINSGRILNMGTNQLSGTPSSTSGTGTLRTQNVGATPIPSGVTWAFTVNYDSGSPQTIVAGNYTTLNGTGGNRTLAASGTIGISSTFTPGAGTYTVTGSTVDFNGTGAQSVPAFNFNNLTLSNARTTNSITLINAGTVGIAGTFNPSATFTSGNYIVTNNTINFNGTVSQTIPAFTYNNLTSSSTGGRVFSSTGVIQIASTFTTGTNLYTIGTSTVRFVTASTTLPVPPVSSGANYFNVEISSGTRTMAATLIIGGDLSVNGGNLTINNNSSNELTVNGNMVLTSGGVDCNPGTTGATNINLKGNFSNTGCVFQNSGTAPNGTVKFNGSGTVGSPQTYSNTTATNVIWINFSAESGTVMQLNSNMSLERETNAFAGKLYIQNGGTVNMQTFTVVASDQDASAGVDSIYIFSGGTLITSNATGVSGSFNDVNTLFSISSGANFEFRGAATGTFTTTPSANTVNSFTVNNASGVSLSQAFTVNGALAFTTGSLTVGTNLLTINGTLSGTTSFTGSATSTITITGTGAIGSDLNMNQASSATRTLNELTINRTSATVTLGNTLELIGTLTLDNGTLASAGNLRLISNASGTARIATIAGTGAITGNVVAERFIPSTARRWRFLSSNITNGTLEDWRGDMYITGAGTGNTVGTLNSNGFDATQSNAASVFYYDETTSGSTNTGWTAQTNNTASLTNVPLVVGRGYRIFVRGDRSSLSRLDETDPSQNAVTLNLTGPVNTGTIAMPVSFTNTGNSSADGWNLLGNPYPSQYDWNAFYDAGNSGDDGTNYTNLSPTIFIYDATAGSYKSYNALTNSGTISNGIIAQGHSFFVKSTGVGTAMNFTEQFKASGAPTQMFKSSALDEMFIRMQSDTSTYDDLIIKLGMTGTSVLHDLYDIVKLNNGTNDIAAYGADSIMHTLHARPLSGNSNDTILLNVTGANGLKKLTFRQVPSLPGKYFYLVDRFLNTVTAINSHSEYVWTLQNSNALSFGKNRFSIIISSSATLPVSLPSFTVSLTEEKNALLKWQTSSEINFSHTEIERSTNGSVFEHIETIKANGGSGTNHYTATDLLSLLKPQLSNTYYYRLKLVDMDGSFVYSPTRIISLDHTDASALPQLTVSPNPASDYVSLNLSGYESKPLEVSVYHPTGILVNTYSISLDTEEIVIETETLHAGLYLIEVKLANGQEISARFIKD